MNDPETPETPSPEDTEQVPEPDDISRERSAPPTEPAGTSESLMPQRSRALEAKELARAMGSAVVRPTREGLKTHLTNHPECLDLLSLQDQDGSNLSLEQRAEKLANEIIDLENKLIGNFVVKLNVAYPNADSAQRVKVYEAIEAVREGFYSVVINGALSGQKLQELIGEINFSKQPGDEIQGRTPIDSDKIVAFTKEGGDGRINIYVYDGFLESGSKAHVIRHELAHPLNESTNIWDEGVFASFIQCARQPESQELSSLPPELAEIVRMVNNPESHANLWSNYISPMLANLSTMEEGVEKARLRGIAAREIAADMTAFYLESSGTVETFSEARMQFSEDQIVPHLLRISGAQSPEEFRQYCADRGANIDIENIDIGDLSQELSKVPEFSDLFGINKIFTDKMRNSLGNRGERIIKRGLQPNIDHADRYFINKLAGGSGSSSKSDLPEGYGGGHVPTSEDGTWDKVWGMLTGKGSSSSNPGDKLGNYFQ